MALSSFNGRPLTKWAPQRRSWTDGSHFCPEASTREMAWTHSSFLLGSMGNWKNPTPETLLKQFVQFTVQQLTGISSRCAFFCQRWVIHAKRLCNSKVVYRTALSYTYATTLNIGSKNSANVITTSIDCVIVLQHEFWSLMYLVSTLSSKTHAIHINLRHREVWLCTKFNLSLHMNMWICICIYGIVISDQLYAWMFTPGMLAGTGESGLAIQLRTYYAQNAHSRMNSMHHLYVYYLFVSVQTNMMRKSIQRYPTHVQLQPKQVSTYVCCQINLFVS